jgi:hypothetical protein
MPQAQQLVTLVRSGVSKELGQLRPANTTAASIYSPTNNVQTNIETIVIANTTTTAATFRLFLDHDSTTYDETTALAWDVSLAGNSFLIVEGPIRMNNANGNLAVRTGTANALTFTVYGMEST